jgi:hypothetical protein
MCSEPRETKAFAIDIKKNERVKKPFWMVHTPELPMASHFVHLK